MVTNNFLDLCITVLACQSKIKKDKILYRDIRDIISSSLEYHKDDVPIQQINKISFIYKYCDLKLKGKTNETVIDSLSNIDKFKNVIDYFEVKKEQELSDTELLDIVNQVRLRKKLNFVISNYDKLENLITSVNGSSPKSLDEVVQDFETTIKMLYTSIIEQNKLLSIESSSSLDLVKDDYDNVLKKIIEKYDRSNVTPTGFQILDDEILNGGFEPSRLYILAGSAGSGKSTLLCNFICNSMQMMDKKEKNIFLYITLENTIEESFVRIYQSLFMKTSEEVLNDISNGVDIKGKLSDELNKTNSTIIMKYFTPKSISPTDIMMTLDELKEEYPECKIKGLYLDYLDLLCSDFKFEINWQEIGQIALSLKALAVEHCIPVITPTHLNSTSYNSQGSDLNLSQISKSVQKVEHSDFMILMIKDPNDDSLVKIKIGKNRNGQSGRSLDFKVDFSHSIFLNCFQSSVSQDLSKNEKSFFSNLESTSYL